MRQKIGLAARKCLRTKASYIMLFILTLHPSLRFLLCLGTLQQYRKTFRTNMPTYMQIHIYIYMYVYIYIYQIYTSLYTHIRIYTQCKQNSRQWPGGGGRLVSYIHEFLYLLYPVSIYFYFHMFVYV